VYELGGTAVTLTELAAEVSRQSGREVAYTNLSPQEYAAMLVRLGLPEAFAAILADSDRGAATGQLDTGTADLAELLGRPPTPLADAVRAALS
jgi:NAD(P)H dehydrogenase (quinone)